MAAKKHMPNAPGILQEQTEGTEKKGATPYATGTLCHGARNSFRSFAGGVVEAAGGINSALRDSVRMRLEKTLQFQISVCSCSIYILCFLRLFAAISAD
jgi:hypothetical protein